MLRQTPARLKIRLLSTHGDKTYQDNKALCDSVSACELRQVKGQQNRGLNITEGKDIPEISSLRGEGTLQIVCVHGEVTSEAAAHLRWRCKKGFLKRFRLYFVSTTSFFHLNSSTCLCILFHFPISLSFNLPPPPLALNKATPCTIRCKTAGAFMAGRQGPIM